MGGIHLLSLHLQISRMDIPFEHLRTPRGTLFWEGIPPTPPTPTPTPTPTPVVPPPVAVETGGSPKLLWFSGLGGRGEFEESTYSVTGTVIGMEFSIGAGMEEFWVIDISVTMISSFLPTSLRTAVGKSLPYFSLQFSFINGNHTDSPVYGVHKSYTLICDCILFSDTFRPRESAKGTNCLYLVITSFISKTATMLASVLVTPGTFWSAVPSYGLNHHRNTK